MTNKVVTETVARINSGNWSQEQWAFINWMALPKDERHPHNEELFAKKMGVAHSTLWRWKQEPDFWDTVNDITRHQIDKHLADIYSALIREAKKGKHQHIKMVLEMAKHYTETRVHTGDKDNPIVVEHDDKREKIKDAIDELAERRKAVG